MPRSNQDRPQAPHPALLLQEKRIDREHVCEWLGPAVDNYVRWLCSGKQNHLPHCSEEQAARCPCVDSGLVDLVILIDGSMGHQVSLVSSFAQAAIAEAKLACPSDLRVTWLTVDNRKPGTSATGTGIYPGTPFTQTHEQYLVAHGVIGPFFHNAATGVGSPNEQGADAIADLSRYFDWRPGACRKIVYISDTTLDSGPIQDSSDVAATANAISVAQANQVAVYAQLVVPTTSSNPAATTQDYQNLCAHTGGSLHAGTLNQGTYIELLRDAICSPCRHRCVEAPLPDLQPCISVSWGDSQCDCMETDDTEVLCITVCNCYSNVTFQGLTIGVIFLTDPNGQWPQQLPDGTDSVQIRPVGPICFGDIPPCTAEGPGCVTREVVVTSRGAVAGDYQIHLLGVCFGISVNYITDDCFRLTLCAD